MTLTAGQRYRMQRRSFFERKKHIMTVEPDELPSDTSMAVMRAIDGLSRDVRELIQEYGLVPVAQLYNDGLRGKELCYALAEYRRLKQRQWLSTNYTMSQNSRPRSGSQQRDGAVAGKEGPK